MSETTAGSPAAVTSVAAATSPVPVPLSPAVAGDRLTWLLTAVQVLTDAGAPLRAAEIVTRATAAGLPCPPPGRAATQTLARDLRALIACGDARVHSPGRGLYAATGAGDPARPVLPVAPLETAIEARGGLRACGLRYDPGADVDLVRRVERLARAYLRARNRGYIGLYDADELAVDALGLHPAVVYGVSWWEPLAASVAEQREAVAAAG